MGGDFCWFAPTRKFIESVKPCFRDGTRLIKEDTVAALPKVRNM